MSMRIRAKEQNGLVTVQSLIRHPMETGLRKDKDGNKIPEHWIQEIVVESAGKQVFSAALNTSVSKDPFLSFAFAGKKGDTLKMSWKDNTGASDSTEVTIS